MFDTKITIFNKKYDEESKYDEYTRTVLDAHWEASRGVQLGDINLTTDTAVTVVIPMSTTGFLYPSEFKNKTKAYILENAHWTLATGDYIVRGEVESIDKFSDLTTFDEKMVISSYEVNDHAKIERLKNYTATGK